ncbi:UV excision repair protein RAD23 homolog B-like [Uranotaenia lowii]|uniref:UV excision repair protein RAD23 homolog B-like n=1 Tax=Uranotaenia lowii TaxID=190385 RepID=UPI00247AFFF3|nr:UV excision repair protein RAD23 homolog B-like [Uranotaenia lowii]
MKITIKTLKQEAFHIEVDVEKDSVRTLKEKFLAESKQDFPVERQRLIYLGKVMADEDPLSQYNLDDKKFVVVMNMKAPAAAAAATPATSTATSEGSSSTTTATAAAKSETTPASASTAEKPKEEEKPKEDSTPAPAAATTPTESQDDLQVKIQRIKEMGYSEEEARIALEICDNNPDRAVEYLLSEIATSSLGGGGGVGGGIGGSGLDLGSASVGSAAGQQERLAFLREHPTFIEMKQLLQEDPRLLPSLLQKIQSSNPDLMRIISENQMEFLALLNEGTDEMQGGGGGGGSGGSGVAHDVASTAASMVNTLTQSDMDAIDRLKALGYPEHLVIQAYIACERNEYQAADFLVSQTLDDDE